MSETEAPIFNKIVRQAVDAANGSEGAAQQIQDTVKSAGGRIAEWWESTWLGQVLSPLTQIGKSAGEFGYSTYKVAKGDYIAGLCGQIWSTAKLINQVLNPGVWVGAQGPAGLASQGLLLVALWPYLAPAAALAVSGYAMYKNDKTRDAISAMSGMLLHKMNGIDPTVAAAIVQRQQNLIDENKAVPLGIQVKEAAQQMMRYSRSITEVAKGNILQGLAEMRIALNLQMNWIDQVGKPEAKEYMKRIEKKVNDTITFMWQMSNMQVRLEGVVKSLKDITAQQLKRLKFGDNVLQQQFDRFLHLFQKPEEIFLVEDVGEMEDVEQLRGMIRQASLEGGDVLNFNDYMRVARNLEEVIGIPVNGAEESKIEEIIDPIQGSSGVPDTYKNRPDVEKPMVIGNDVVPVIEKETAKPMVLNEQEEEVKEQPTPGGGTHETPGGLYPSLDPPDVLQAKKEFADNQIKQIFGINPEKVRMEGDNLIITIPQFKIENIDQATEDKFNGNLHLLGHFMVGTHLRATMSRQDAEAYLPRIKIEYGGQDTAKTIPQAITKVLKTFAVSKPGARNFRSVMKRAMGLKA